MLLSAALFIGSQACGTCHQEIASAYAKTPMAMSSGRAEPIPPVEFTAASRKYRIAGNTLTFPGGTVPIDYFVGSKAAGRSFIFAKEQYLFELPVTWYSQRQKWDASPGYEHDTGVQLNRAIEPSCLLCHSSRVRPVLGTQNRYGDPPFLENGVSCERCHGPGSEHVRNPTVAHMVNPAQLDPERRDAVCSQCHLTGEARVERAGRHINEFQAGEKLADYATFLARDVGADRLRVTSHVEKLASSGCKRASGDKLWCGTCHDPHTTVSKTQAACIGCHAAAHHQEQVCATCHMPKAHVVDGGHGVLTDHSIPSGRKSPGRSPGGELVAILGTADDRAFGLAYSAIGDKRAREYLLRAEPADAEVKLRLAATETDDRRAMAFYESVLRADRAQTVALVNLGSLYANAGRLEEAAKLWERALAANPGIEAAALNLARIRPPTQARAILLRYLEFNPASAAVRELVK
jgi:Cytochrome c554 and c-prime